MSGTKRSPIGRRSGPKITREAVELFRSGLRLLRRPDGEDSREYLDICYELDRVLGLRPWEESILNTVGYNEPGEWQNTEAERTDWFRSKDLCRQLDAALAAERKAKREAKRREKAAATAPDQPPPS
jgi:hypothetical protein